MNKAEELNIIKDTISKLGDDSYCGPWLLDMLPIIEREMQSDIPLTSYCDIYKSELRCKAQCAEMLAEAKEINEKAKEHMQAMRSKAREEADAIIRRAVHALVADVEKHI